MSADYKSYEDVVIQDPPQIVQIILALLSTFLCGFVVKMLWAWYVVPLGLPAITLIHAIGIDFLITFLCMQGYREPVQNTFWLRFIYSIVAGLVTLFFGFVFHLFM